MSVSHGVFFDLFMLLVSFACLFSLLSSSICYPYKNGFSAWTRRYSSGPADARFFMLLMLYAK